MKISVNIECANADEVTAVQNALAPLFGKTATVDEVKVTAGTKKTKAAPVAADPEPAADLGFDDEPAVKEEPKKLTLEDVIQGFKEYAQKHGRDNAGKVLGKFGVKSVRDLKEDSFEKVMKALK